jgi:hypothetical protein
MVWMGLRRIGSIGVNKQASFERWGRTYYENGAGMIEGALREPGPSTVDLVMESE